MSPDRWQKLKELYYEALRHTADDRAGFLRRECSGDESLRTEVEGLLAEEQAGTFLGQLLPSAIGPNPTPDAKPPPVFGLAPGQQISHYRLEAKLGEGGMGVVYRAVDLQLDRPVALKFLSPYLVGDEEAQQRFVVEAKAAAALDHPNVCTVHEIANDEGRTFIAMAYVEGPTLDKQIAGGRLELSDAIDLALQTAQGLESAHGRGIVHRDIKPANLIVASGSSSQPLVKILDFGLARLTEQSRITRGFATMGTVAYMSPEQTVGEDVDHRTDLWSLGAVLYEMVTGQRPFKGHYDQAVVYAITNEDPKPVNAIRAGVPPELESIIGKLLAKDPDARYQNATDLIADLGGLKSSGTVENGSVRLRDGAPPLAARPVTGRSKRRTPEPRKQGIAGNNVARFAIAALILLLAGIGAFWVVNREKPSPGAGTTVDSSISSLAILPLRSLNQEADDSFLGLGVADALITKVGQVGKLRVSPISAVLKYRAGETDSIDAARQLKVDTVLDGSIQQSGDRTRVSVQLLRTSDGVTLWAESFDIPSAGLFDLQDGIAGKVIERLSVELSAEQRRRIERRQTSSPEAFLYHSKAMYHLANRGFFPSDREESDLAIAMLQEAVARDPEYAIAHANLGYAYVWTAAAMEHNPGLIERAKQELSIAERLDPELAEVHVARGQIHWTQYGRWRADWAIRELRLAQQLNPNAAHRELASVYCHIGLEDLWRKHREQAFALDPNGETSRREFISELFNLLLVDEGQVQVRKFFNRPPDARYYLQKRMFAEAAELVERNYRADPRSLWNRMYRALVLILQGQRDAALAELNSLAAEIEKSERSTYYHHWTYMLVRGYALLGRAADARRWMWETVNEGLPCYPAFERDWMLDWVREDPEFARLLAEVRLRWETYRREFGQAD